MLRAPRTALALLLAVLVAAPATAGSAARRGLQDLVLPRCDMAATRAALAGDASPFGFGACSGVRPGAYIETDVGGCTLAFLYKGADGYRYAATAGHCVLGPDVDGDKKWKAGTGPVVKDAAGKVIGRFAYAHQQGSYVDFALVRLDRRIPASPQMCHFGGPTATNHTVSVDSVNFQNYSHGVAVGDLVPGRTSHAPFGLYQADYVWSFGAFAPGDSGGPVISDDGRAVGVVASLGVSGFGNNLIIRVGPAVQRASKMLKTRLTLMTAKTL